MSFLHFHEISVKNAPSWQYLIPFHSYTEYELSYVVHKKGFIYKNFRFLLYVRSGKVGEQLADFRFRIGFPEYVVSNDKLIFVFVDGSGSGFAGNQILHSVAGQPGQLEVQDIEEVLRLKQKNGMA